MDIYKYLPFRPYLAVFKELEQITDIASMTKEERLRYDESIPTEIIARTTGLNSDEISTL